GRHRQASGPHRPRARRSTFAPQENRTMRLLSPVTLAVLVLGASVVAPGTGAGAAERATFKVRQEAPVLVTVDIGNEGSSHGDILAFEATITREDGTAGILRGMLTTVDIPAGDDLLE